MATAQIRPHAPTRAEDRPGGQRVFLVRHGRTGLNAQGRLRGRSDPPLDEVGARQAHAVAQTLAGQQVARVVSSPLRRAAQTAQAIGRSAGVSVTTVDALTDRDYGMWAGQLQAEVIARSATLDAAPGVEPAAAVTARAVALLQAQLSVVDEGALVLVSHDAVISALLGCLIPGAAASLRPGGWVKLRPVTGRWQASAVTLHPAPASAAKEPSP